MKNSESTICRAVEAQSNYQRVENYIYEVQENVKQQFHTDFKQLSRKIQYFIIQLVKQHNRLKTQNNPSATDIEYIVTWLDAYNILSYSSPKIIFYVTELYLKGYN